MRYCGGSNDDRDYYNVILTIIAAMCARLLHSTSAAIILNLSSAHPSITSVCPVWVHVRPNTPLELTPFLLSSTRAPLQRCTETRKHPATEMSTGTLIACSSRKKSELDLRAR